MPVIRTITELFTKLKDGSGNLITSTDLGSGKRGIDVYVTPTTAPTGTIPVEIMARSIATGSTSINVSWVIPLNTTIVLQRFLGGQYPNSGNASELGLYYDVVGYWTANSYLISLGYVGSGDHNYTAELNNKYIGDGTKAIIARRRRLDATNREMYFRWIGYVEYNTLNEHVSSVTVLATETAITDTTKSWSINEHVGRYVILNNKTPLKIISNTATVLVVIGNSQFGAGQSYKIITFNL